VSTFTGKPQTTAPAANRTTIGHSVAEIRHILARLVLKAADTVEHVLAWTSFRLRHQTRALISHYRRREDPVPWKLRM
jgi:hypothetical protein